MAKLSEVPMAKLMEVVPKLSTNFAGDPVAFNLTVESWESQKEILPRPDWYMKFGADGAIACGEGHVNDPEAIAFIIKKANGYQTLLGMFVHGLADGTPSCAQMSMMMGKIGIPMPKLKQVQSFFKRVQIGIDPIKAALAAAGIAIDGE